MSSTPTIDVIADAAERIRPVAVRTPLLQSAAINQRLGASVYFKPETLQRTGSFKFRGAYTKISRLSDAQRQRGVVAFSSGNHAQGVAAAAGLFGISATIVMPEDAPQLKISNTRALGANVVLYDRYTEDREAIGTQISTETGAILVKPFDDPGIVSGQGTCGLEIVQDMKSEDVLPDLVLCPCGGGGLLAGLSIALQDGFPGIDIRGVEPEDFDDTLRSFESGERASNDPAARTICDALASPMPGEVTLSINRQNVSGILCVSDLDVERAVAEAFKTLKLVVEPGGAVALAALLNDKIDVSGKTVVVVLSGGNVDPGLFARILRRHGGLD